jgi:hypothetical protein
MHTDTLEDKDVRMEHLARVYISRIRRQWRGTGLQPSRAVPSPRPSTGGAQELSTMLPTIQFPMA